ncbi:MAG: hypothetical protein D6743_02805 [Calditrichaeota bacterium]|nr:MAG: hypothetical protein D6743_02805 [Calditrichota bacterium]
MKTLADRLLRLVLAVVFVLVAADALSAQAGRAGAFLRRGVGARAKAMGDAYTALATGIEATFYNPAALPLLGHKELILSYRALSLDRQFSFVGFGMPIQPKVKGKTRKRTINGGFSLSWIRAAVNDIDARDTDGQHLDNLSNSENAFIFSFALNPAPRVSVGLSVKVLLNRFPDVGLNGATISATGVGFDLGVLLVPTEWLRVGLVVKDINSQYRWNTQDLFGENGSEIINKFPRAFRAGVAVKPTQLRGLTVAVDFEQFYDSRLFQDSLDERFHLGVEGVVQKDLFVRGGLDDGSLTAGGGYRFSLLGKKSQLNYSFVSAGNRPEEEHVFTWIFEF